MALIAHGIIFILLNTPDCFSSGVTGCRGVIHIAFQMSCKQRLKLQMKIHLF
jgi:hypothetical protein